MSTIFWLGPDGDSSLQLLWQDADRVLCRRWRQDSNGKRHAVLAAFPAEEHPTPSSIERLAHAYALKDELDGSWAVLPVALETENGRTILVLEDPGGEPLARRIGAPMEVKAFLQLAIGIADAVGKLHQHRLVHKDLKPSKILVDCADGRIRLAGFGLASRLPREHQTPAPPELIAGTLPYMAPEQTGRMNRSIDSRSDLYSLGVVLYQMLTGSLPFTALDPMEWVHCHVARQPVAPAERAPGVPAVLSAIVMKLLAKSAERRYQTAFGLESDLRRCRAEWDARGYIGNFPLGEHDIPDRLFIPEKLYGREQEIATLLAAFDRIAHGGAPELVLVRGHSGVGKSSVVNELLKALVPMRGLFAAGKFEQYKREIPYATLAQAFQGLVRSLSGKSPGELNGWRDALREGLDPNGQLIADLVPELKLIIGDQPAVPDLPPQYARKRFQLVFRRLVGVFARAEHPLVLFLDDLQWLDEATLDLLEDMLTQPELHHLILVGAYRDNEVDAAHPLLRRLEAIKIAGGRVSEIALAPLACEHLGQLVADALHCEPEHVAPLARLLHAKTGGNPFFAIQFLGVLANEELIRFDQAAGHWCWDLERIRATGYTENVVDLMVGRLTRLPAETQATLQFLACLGNMATIEMLSLIAEVSRQRVQAALWAAVDEELVVLQGGAYRFPHDRIREAAYSLIAEASRAANHFRIGKLLLAHAPPDKREDLVFEIVNQLNHGAGLITGQDEREQLAELNLLAGKRAKGSAAYASALGYLSAGAALLPRDAWERRYGLAFEMELHRAECEFLTGALPEAEHHLTVLATRAQTTVDQAMVTCLRADLYTTLDLGSRAVAVGLEYLCHLGIDWSPHPTEAEARGEYDRIWLQLGDRTIGDLMQLPLMSDPASLATLDLLTKLGPPALHTDPNLFSLVICRAVNLSLEGGNCDGSCFAYVRLGMIAGPRFGDYPAGLHFGRLGYDLIEQRGLKRFQARTYMCFASFVLPWTRRVRAARDLLRRAQQEASKIGDLTYIAYSGDHLTTNLLAAGDPLAEVQLEAESVLAFAQKARFGIVTIIASAQLGLVKSLRGLTPTFGSFDGDQFDELRVERQFACNRDLDHAECWYWIRKMQVRFFANQYSAAFEACLKARLLLWSLVSHLETAEYHFYGALSRAALFDVMPTEARQEQLDAMAAHHQQLQVWSENCPENFENRTALVGAEIARIEGRLLAAEHLYERAIRSARANGFVHHEALAYELAARFYATRGFKAFSEVYLRNARDCYVRWGAEGKVRQLEGLHPRLGNDKQQSEPVGTIGMPVEHLDLATVVKVSQAVSSEIVLDSLLNTLLRTALEHAGADRGLLILLRGAERRIAAEASTSGGAVTVLLRNETVTAAALPQLVFDHVLQRLETVVLDDAAAPNPFSADGYIQQNQARSILCMPLISQAKLIGVLYLENNLAPGAFASGRIAVLKLLASQASIALENARLYNDLEEREAKIRRLVDSNIIGIMIWELGGRILEANEAFLRIVGYSREDVTEARLRWTDLTPSEWLDRKKQLWIRELKVTGRVQPFEMEYLRKDGSRVPVLVGVASFEEGGNQGISFVLDLTQPKRSEAEARESERRYHQVQMELEHANRLTTLGQLTASITHEVSQPIAATVTNAQAALRWLSRQPPDLEEVGQALGRIVTNASRAGDVIDRTRALIKKAPPRKGPFEINAAIREVIELTHAEAVKNAVSVEARLEVRLPYVLGDRVQLQQVVLNLIVNAVEAMADVRDGVRELIVSTEKAGPHGVRVAIEDSGPGVAPATVERVFDPFYTTKPTGLGMGLAVCRSIIAAHDGRLWAAANVPRGAVFQFTVPSSADRTT